MKIFLDFSNSQIKSLFELMLEFITLSPSAVHYSVQAVLQRVAKVRVLHYIFYPKRLTTSAITPDHQYSQNPASTLAFKYWKCYCMGLCVVLHTEVRSVFILYSYWIESCSWNRWVFSWKMCGLSAVLISMGWTFHHFGASIANMHVFVERHVFKSQWSSSEPIRPMKSQMQVLEWMV